MLHAVPCAVLRAVPCCPQQALCWRKQWTPAHATPWTTLPCVLLRQLQHVTGSCGRSMGLHMLADTQSHLMPAGMLPHPHSTRCAAQGARLAAQQQRAPGSSSRTMCSSSISSTPSSSRWGCLPVKNTRLATKAAAPTAAVKQLLWQQCPAAAAMQPRQQQQSTATLTGQQSHTCALATTVSWPESLASCAAWHLCTHDWPG